LCDGADRRLGGGSGKEEMCAFMEILPFIWVIIVVVQEFHLQSAFHAFSELLVEPSHVHLVLLYVGEAPFVDEELADAAE
jgi:hypothetical protein